ncbi:uncharacterized protein DSM5745_10446 [Aspergillus mulundensis]|uniref:Carrier domain-containing protein n=1 Tax=Aspergillus mulundensis TaxID=1810919 RepID=A0A3D8QK13_9EURO|nr:hypothetical protein DSM5745_10446 [Aspergillus mulundensis]RDW61774.1 hypothetical protein DSM5745_10446 [Aspergillus mulundensis]
MSLVRPSQPVAVPVPNGKEHPNPEPTVERTVPLSYGQSRFWFLSQLVPDQTALNITFRARLNGPLRYRRLAAAVAAVGRRHEALRTAFATDAQHGGPMQVVLAASPLSLEYCRVTSEDEVEKEYRELKAHVYDLETGRTMRIRLLSLSPLVNFLLVGYHHINMDGVSFEVLLGELDLLYKAGSLPDQALLQYPDYAVRQRAAISSARGTMDEAAAFWRRELHDAPGALPILPFAAASASRPTTPSYSNIRVDARIPASLNSRIRAVAAANKVSPYTFHLAVYATLLSRLFSTTDLIIGVGDSGRSDPDARGSIGLFLNILPLRLRLSNKDPDTDGTPFVHLLKNARRTMLAALAHSAYPFDAILDLVHASRSSTHNPLFQAFMNYRSSVNEKRTFAGCEALGEEYAAGGTAYDITVDVLEGNESGSLVMLSVLEGLYTKDNARVLLEMYMRLLDVFSADVMADVHTVSLFAKDEVERGLRMGRGSTMRSTWPETLIHRVDDITSQSPDVLALSDGSGAVTYAQMALRTTQIASVLQHSGIKRRSLVAMYVEPSADAVCCMLATMRLGAVYVPLDVRSPASRLATIVTDCMPAALLTDGKSDAGALGANCPVVSIANLASTTSTVPISTTATDTAALLYTSGTTGTPKGVKLTHAGLRNLMEGYVMSYGITAHNVLQQTALSFDFSLEQIFTALALGGTLVIVPREKRGDPASIARTIRESHVTYAAGTPLELLSWVQYGAPDLKASDLQVVVAGGEQYTPDLYRALTGLGKGLQLLNIYGPTEVTVACSKIELTEAEAMGRGRIPAGFTLPNCAVYILDHALNALPPGYPGEVFIGGAGVGGYLDDALTAARFLPDPFASEFAQSHGWTRMYRTGDRGMLRDGALVILGRMDGDTQVKIRGIRIEVEEVEKAVLQCAGGRLAGVVVTPRGEPPAYLVAHVVFTDQSPGILPTEEHASFLKTLRRALPLPETMRPAVMAPIRALPLNAHGKLDRKSLAALELDIPPTLDTNGASNILTPAEAQLRALWERVIPPDILGFHSLSPASDFFQVGGNSMSLVALHALIRKELDAPSSLTLAALFQSSSLGKMADAITGSATTKNGSIAANNDSHTRNMDTDEIDWTAETSLPSLSLPAPVHPPRTIALTGATGFVGRHILRRLLASPTTQGLHIHCLAVRNPTSLTPFFSHPRPDIKITIHDGDLASPTLGLSPSTFAALSASLDCIIHNGADVSFMKSYASLRAANVTSTKTLIKLAMQAGRAVPLHYVSSAVVGRLMLAQTSSSSTSNASSPYLDAEFPPVSVSSFPPPPGYSDAYGMTKWASEVVLERANKTVGLPVVTHRLSSVTVPAMLGPIFTGIPNSNGTARKSQLPVRTVNGNGNGNVNGTGTEEREDPEGNEEDIPPLDLMHNVLRFSRLLRAVPVSEHWTGSLDFVCVGTVARGIVREIEKGSPRRGEAGVPVQFRHHCGDAVVPLTELRALLMDEDAGESEVQEVPLGQWISRAREAGMSGLVAAVLEGVEGGEGVLVFQRLRRE